jgi:hypothetical protein
MLNTLRIIKARWPEVMLITGLQALIAVAFGEARSAADKQQVEILGLIAILCTGLWLLSTMLTIGFARSVFIDGSMAYQPWTLVEIGYKFFWRIFAVLVIAFCVGVVLSVGISFLLLQCGISEDMLQKPVISITVSFAILILIAKLILLCPALIMVTNCGVFESIHYCRNFSLLRLGKLLIVFFVWVSVFTVINMHFPGNALLNNRLILTVLAVASGFVTLLTYLLAIQAVEKAYLADSEGKFERAEEKVE